MEGYSRRWGSYINEGMLDLMLQFLARWPVNLI
jgi:hypothetical protein